MATTFMSAATSPFLEPFPLWKDGAFVESADYFSNISSKMSALHAMARSPNPQYSRPRISIPDKLSNKMRLWHYQYEVTFGLYMLTPGEKMVLNTVVLLLAALLVFALYEGLGVFTVNLVCRIIYYMIGSSQSAGTVCDGR